MILKQSDIETRHIDFFLGIFLHKIKGGGRKEQRKR